MSFEQLMEVTIDVVMLLGVILGELAAWGIREIRKERLTRNRPPRVMSLREFSIRRTLSGKPGDNRNLPAEVVELNRLRFLKDWLKSNTVRPYEIDVKIIVYDERDGKVYSNCPVPCVVSTVLSPRKMQEYIDDYLKESVLAGMKEDAIRCSKAIVELPDVAKVEIKKVESEYETVGVFRKPKAGEMKRSAATECFHGGENG